MEDPDHQFLVLALFVRGVGIDQDGLRINNPFGQLIGAQDQVQCIFDFARLHVEGGAAIEPDITVEHEVDPAAPGDGLQQGAHCRIPEVQTERARFSQAAARTGSQALLQLQLTLHHQQICMARRIAQGGCNHPLCSASVALRGPGSRFVQSFSHAPVLFKFLFERDEAGVVGVDFAGAREGFIGLVCATF